MGQNVGNNRFESRKQNRTFQTSYTHDDIRFLYANVNIDIPLGFWQ